MVRSHARRSGISSVDDLESESVSTGSLCNKQDILVSGGSKGYVTRIDPSTTSAPIQDAIDEIKGALGAGTIFLPPGQTSTAGDLTGLERIKITGSSETGSTIKQTDDSVPMFNFTTSGDARATVVEDVIINGPGTSTATSPAVKFDTAFYGTTFRNVDFRNWNPPAGVIEMGGGGPYGAHWGELTFRDNTGNCISSVGGSGTNTLLAIDKISAYNNDASDVLDLRDHRAMDIGYLNIGGTANFGIRHVSDKPSLRVGHINFEPTGGSGATIVFDQGNGYTELGHIIANGVDISEMVTHTGGNCVIHSLRNDSSTISNNKIRIGSEPTSPSWYFGEPSDIQNDAGTSTGLVRSLASAGTGNG